MHPNIYVMKRYHGWLNLDEKSIRNWKHLRRCEIYNAQKIYKDDG